MNSLGTHASRAISAAMTETAIAATAAVRRPRSAGRRTTASPSAIPTIAGPPRWARSEELRRVTVALEGDARGEGEARDGDGGGERAQQRAA